jgi:hypothetical protein
LANRLTLVFGSPVVDPGESSTPEIVTAWPFCTIGSDVLIVNPGTSVCSMITEAMSETAGVLRASPWNFTRTS